MAAERLGFAPCAVACVIAGASTDQPVSGADNTASHAPRSSAEPLDPGFRTEAIYDERYVVVFPPGHRFERSNAVALREVSGEPYVDRLACELREMVMAVCRDYEVELYAKFRSEREDRVQGMVMAGIGFAFMPECSVTLAGLLSRPLVEPEVARTVMLTSMPGRPHTPATAAFVRAVRAHNWPGWRPPPRRAFVPM